MKMKNNAKMFLEGLRKFRESHTIFDENYYRLKAICRSERFSIAANNIYKQLSEAGYPVPEQGFSNQTPTKKKAFDKWSSSLEKKDISPQQLVMDLLKEFGMNKRDKNFKNLSYGMFQRIYFKSEVSPSMGIDLRWELDKNEGFKELWIGIYPWTTKDDVEDAWGLIQIIKSLGALNKLRIKQWENFDRDLKLYMLYLMTKQNIGKGRFIKSARTDAHQQVSKSVYNQMMQDKRFEDIELEYKCRITLINLEKIIRHCNKLLGNIHLI